MLNSVSYSLPDALNESLAIHLADWQTHDGIFRLWSKDSSLWTGSDESKWLGWLEAVDIELRSVEIYRAFAKEIAAADFRDVVLLGMGGSSLCPEVLALTFGKENFHILDSTVPAQIKTLESKLDLSKTLFIVASKSGSTLEPNCFKQYFFERVSETIGRENAGKNFVAITDPNSKMQKVAERDKFRKIFFGNPEIGGRFSALSPFGMAAGAAMGIDVEEFLSSAKEMVHACKSHLGHENPGVVLGSILGTAHSLGRDKLTIFASPEIRDLGAWLEQLIAESTGKNGVAIIPVDREPIQKPDTYGTDRLFVYLKLKGSNEFDEKISVLEHDGHPIIRITLADKMNLGQEFFRWEFATAVAGSLMRINPFNQPDVEAAKIEAKKITSAYEETGKLPEERPFYEESGLKLLSDVDNIAELTALVGSDKSLSKFLEAHLSRIKPNDYFALLAYVEMNSENEIALQKIRRAVLEKYRVATCLGFGPRFLHSTGQAYKGGADNGVLLQITSDDADDLNVPQQEFTFGVVKSAQARGDFQVLLDRGRRALRLHLGAEVKSDLERLLLNFRV